MFSFLICEKESKNHIILFNKNKTSLITFKQLHRMGQSTVDIVE